MTWHGTCNSRLLCGEKFEVQNFLHIQSICTDKYFRKYEQKLLAVAD
jgi:hypothetical protein